MIVFLYVCVCTYERMHVCIYITDARLPGARGPRARTQARARAPAPAPPRAHRARAPPPPLATHPAHVRHAACAQVMMAYVLMNVGM